MKKVFFALMALMGLMCHQAQAQMIIDTWSFSTGVDTTLWMDLGEDYMTLFAGSNGYQNYASSGLRDIGFPFTLGTTTHTKFSTNVNGTVRLGTQLPSSGYITEPLGQNINAGPRIDALGRAGMIDASCYMRSAVLGDSGSRVLVVEARLREYADRDESEGHYVHFQVQLFEAGGLRVVYGQVDSGAIYGSSQNGVAATGNSSNKDVVFFDFASQRAVRFNGNCTLRNAAEVFPTKGRWYMIAPDPEVCPWPSTVTIPTNPDAGGVLLTRIAGDSNTMRVMIHAMDIDTVWEGTESTMVLPPVNPTTTYTLSLQTLCGSDTSYRTRDIDFFSGCGAVVRLPWETAFTTLSYSDCWDMPYVSGNNADFSRRWRNPQTGEIRCPGVSGTYNSWLKAPVFYLPDTNGITLKWDYKATASSGVSPHVELRVAPCDAEGTVVSDAEWVTVWTSDVEVASYTTYYANLDVWRGQRVRVAFVRTGEGGGTAYIDNVMLYQQQAPVFEWETPTVAHTGDTAIFSAAWLAGVDSNVTWIWHSALMDTTVVIADPTASTVPLVYTVAGWDTVTLIVSNVYGSDSAQAVVDVVDCSTIAAFPWMDDFTHSTDCWNIDGWTFQGSVSAYDFDGNNRYCSNVYYANNTGKYMLMQPVTVPATGAEHLSLWVEADGPLMVRVSPTGVLDTAAYTDTLLIVPDVSNRKEIWWRTASLASYAGQTVSAGLFKMDGTQAFVSAVKVDFDTLPVLGTVSVASRSRTDSTNVCRAELRYGAIDGLTFTWHSTLMDTTIVTTGSTASIAPITYTVGGWDTITVVMSNAYGTDTAVRVVQVMDCHPVLALPWREEFDDGLDCWYLTQNNTSHQWQMSYRHFYYDNIYHENHYAASQCNFSESSTTPADAWMVSRAVTLPADTALTVRLFWEVAISSGNNLTNNYRVMVSTAADCTDTTLFEELYHDTLPLPNQTGFAQRSVSLAAYAGQTVFIAFRNQPLVRRATALMIGNVEVRTTVQPKLQLAVNNDVFYYGDTAIFTATLMEGSDSGLVYIWHSSLLDSTWTTNGDNTQCCLTYGMVNGTDTVTMLATNAYGSDTASVEVTSTIISEPTVYLVAEGRQFNKAEVGDTVVYRTTRNRCVTTGMTYLFHSSLMDTTITVATTADTVRLPIVYSVAGIDTFTVVLSNNYDTSLTVPVYMTVLECPTMGVPFFEDFEGTTLNTSVDCWYGDDWTAQPTRDGAGMMVYYFDLSNDGMLISPLIDLPADTTIGLQLSWQADILIYSSSNIPSKIMVSPTGGKHIEDFTDTLYTGVDIQNGISGDSVFLDAYRGQSVRIGFPVVHNNPWGYDNIRIDYNRTAPQVSLDVPAVVILHDIVLLVATLNACSPQGLSVSWHSTLLDSTWVVNGFDGVNGFNGEYEVAGVDTITVIVANAYGADTAVAIVQVVDCSGQSLPYTEDFEAIAVGTLPACWSNTWTGSNSGYAPRVVDQNSFQVLGALPGHGLIMVAGTNVGYGTETMAILPRMGDSLQHLSVAFDYRFEVSNQGTLEVGYYDGDTFTALQTMIPQVQTYRRDTVLLNNVAVPDAQIALRWTHGSVWYAVYIDNIEVFQTPASLLAPQVAITAPASVLLTDSATYTVTLNDRCSLDGLSFIWHSTLLDSTIVTIESTVTLGYTVGGIDTVTVIASNAYGADTAIAMVHVIDCSGAAVPYFEDFSGVTATASNVSGELPACWDYYWNGSNAAYAPHIISNGGYQYISNIPDNALLFVAGSYTGYGSSAVVRLPHFADSLQRLVLALDYRFESSSCGTLSVGWFDSNEMFHTVKILTGHQGNYLRDTVLFADHPAANYRIALWWEYGSSWYAAVVDNIEVFVDNDIPAPVGLTADNITASCATLRWNAVTGATAYHLILPGIVDTLLADTALSVCGLDEDSDYGFGVYAHVGDEVGHFSGLHPFHTLLYCMPLASLSANVDGIVRWQYDTTGEFMGTGVALEIADVTNGAMWADTVLGDSLVYPFAIGHRYSLTARTLCGNAEAHTTLTIPLQIPASVCAESAGSSTATNERFMDNFWSRNYSQIIYPASFAAGIDTLFGIALRVSQFSQPFADTANYNYDIFLGQTDSATLSAPLTSDSLTQVAFNKRITIRSAGWIEIPFDSVYPCNPTGNLIVTLVERTSSAYSGRHYGVHTDASCTHFVQSTENHYYTNPSTLNFDWDITTDIPDIRLLGGCSSSLCLAPVAAISAVDTHHVELQWVARGSEGLWQVEYRPAGQSAWTVADTTSANSYTVGGLHAMTTYEFRVASICDGGLQYGSTLTATTPCGEILLPYHIDFRNNEIPCWTIDPDISHSSYYGLYMSSNKQVISPLVVGNIANLYATIKTHGGSSSSYYTYNYAVGVCNGDGGNLVWVDTITLSTQYGDHEHTVYFNNYSGMGDHIIIKIISGIIDLREFDLDYVDFCIPAQNVEVTGITDSSAVLQWTANASGHTFAVYLDNVLQTVTSATTYSFTGLAPRTRHLAAVHEICGVGDTAAAATRYFRTRCTPTTDLPYFEEFDYSSDLYGDTIGLPPCWDSIGYSHISFSSFSGGALTVMTFYSFEDYSGPYTSYLATPLLNIPSQGARIRFKGQTGHDDVVTAGIMTDPTDASTFIPMATITYNNRGLAWYEFTTEGLDSLNSQFAVAFRWASEGSGSLDSLFVTALPEGHTVTVTANEEGVCETYGSGVYADGSSVVIGYRLLDTLPQGGHWEFLGWSDGASGNPRTLVVTSDTAVVALFEWVTDPVTDTVWRTVTVRLVDLATGNTIEESDVVYVEGAGRYMDSTMVTLTAHYADTPLFYGWVTTAGDTISSNPFRFIVTCDTLITAVYAPLPVGIDEVESSKWEVEIFPNPATTEVTILTQALKQSDNQAITILDLHGRVVYTQAIRYSSTQAITIDISSLPRGVYYVRIGSVVKKLVIQ